MLITGFDCKCIAYCSEAQAKNDVACNSRSVICDFTTALAVVFPD
jgi:hypothetical protein